MRLERIVAFPLIKVLTWRRDHDTSPNCHAVREEGCRFLAHEVFKDVHCDDEIVALLHLCHSRESLDRVSDNQVIVNGVLDIAEVWSVTLDSVDDNPAAPRVWVPRDVPVFA